MSMLLIETVLVGWKDRRGEGRVFERKVDA